MTTTTNVSQFKLNIVTQQQYNTMTINSNEFYLVTDAAISYNDLSNLPNLGTMAYEDTTDYQETLISGTNLKTINNTSLLGSGNITVGGSLPSQTSQSGKFLTTDGTDASWSAISQVPSQSGQSGKFLTTNGSTASWANAPTELPSQSGQSGKYLTTNGSAVSWGTPTVSEVTSQSSGTVKFWTGTQTAYDNLLTYDSTTLYIITGV